MNDYVMLILDTHESVIVNFNNQNAVITGL